MKVKIRYHQETQIRLVPSRVSSSNQAFQASKSICEFFVLLMRSEVLHNTYRHLFRPPLDSRNVVH